MRRALASLKYVPAVLCGLLVVAWVVGFFWRLELPIVLGDSSIALGIDGARLTIFYFPHTHGGLTEASFVPRFALWTLLGGYHYEPVYLSPTAKAANLMFVSVAIPIPALLTTVLALAVGCFTRFRFPLWSYFVWTALVAAELAYYLR